jgi:hypothetical protein
MEVFRNLTLKTEAAGYSETLVAIYQTAWRHNSENSNRQELP